ncbi:MAG: histidine kinase [Acidobacteria bacterium]|nr:histidine kinase [Acidobacteriota bacterium]
MNSQAAATIINLLAFLTGIVLYTMLLVMLLGARRNAAPTHTPTNKLPLATALLGLSWNLGAFAVFGLERLSATTSLAGIEAFAFTALGFLPAVVVHSVLRSGETMRGRSLGLTWAAYGLSAVASALHFVNVVTAQQVPSHVALHLLTFGFTALIVLLLLLTLKRQGWQQWWRSAGWVIALAVFAVSASHLSHHEGAEYAWWVELIGHHSALPLALVILYQDYRFALADIFLKRALAWLSLVGLAATLYFVVAAPSLAESSASDPRVVGVLLALWIVTALSYPALQRGAHWLVDAIILQRVDYEVLCADVARIATQSEDPEALLTAVCRRIAQALTAQRVMWEVVAETEETARKIQPRFLSRRKGGHAVPAITTEPTSKVVAAVPVLTAEAPAFRLLIGELAGGRRLLSDDWTMLEAVALLCARRIDAMRVTHERYEHELQAQEMTALATEAELRALRAQINPHFLFNALTTIGYLIQEAPDRAVQTLLRLTGLLRGVLRRSEGEFTTLGEEVELIADYLEIEQARFEARLRVTIDVPPTLCALRLPALLLQPLVENAIKHGIAPVRSGGEVIMRARVEAATQTLHLCVQDTGAGASSPQLAQGQQHGIGLANVERRLHGHYGTRARMQVQTAVGQGMQVELTIPLPAAEALSASIAYAAAPNGGLK